MASESRGAQMDSDDREGQFYFGILSICLCGLLVLLVVIDFLSWPDAQELTWVSIVALALAALILLAPFFDKLSVARLLSVERRARSEEKKRYAAEERADRLMMQISQISTNHNYNRNESRNTIILVSEDSARHRRDDPEKHGVSANFMSYADSFSEDREFSNNDDGFFRARYSGEEEDFLIRNAADLAQVRDDQIVREVSLKSPGLSASGYRFDAYAQNSGVEYFFEFKRMPLEFWLREQGQRLMQQISGQLEVCREYAANRRSRFKLMWLIVLPEQDIDNEYRRFKLAEILQEAFRTAVAQGEFGFEIVTEDELRG